MFSLWSFNFYFLYIFLLKSVATIDVFILVYSSSYFLLCKYANNLICYCSGSPNKSSKSQPTAESASKTVEDNVKTPTKKCDNRKISEQKVTIIFSLN